MGCCCLPSRRRGDFFHVDEVRQRRRRFRRPWRDGWRSSAFGARPRRTVRGGVDTGALVELASPVQARPLRWPRAARRFRRGLRRRRARRRGDAVAVGRYLFAGAEVEGARRRAGQGSALVVEVAQVFSPRSSPSQGSSAWRTPSPHSAGRPSGSLMPPVWKTQAGGRRARPGRSRGGGGGGEGTGRGDRWAWGGLGFDDTARGAALCSGDLPALVPFSVPASPPAEAGGRGEQERRRQISG